MKKKTVFTSSFLAMFVGFLSAIVGLMQFKVSADSAVGPESYSQVWSAVSIAGIALILLGLLGFIFAVAISER